MNRRDQSEDLGVDGRIIFEWILKGNGVDWMDLAQDRGQWRGLVKTAMKFQIP
jgi:hypothetical protein